MKKLLGWALVFGAAAIAAGQVDWIDRLNPFKTDRIDRSGSVIVRSIEDLGQFHAAVGNFEVIVDIEDDTNHVPDFIAGERSLFKARGTVNAYVDFSDLDKDAINVSGDKRSVTIDLPEAKLDKVNLDQEFTELVSKDRGLWNRLEDAMSTDDQQSLYLAAEKKIANAADETNLLATADANTRALLTGMFAGMDMKVIFE